MMRNGDDVDWFSVFGFLTSFTKAGEWFKEGSHKRKRKNRRIRVFGRKTRGVFFTR